MPDGRFHYTWEGQHGDQRMIAGNLSILDHRRDGRASRVFLRDDGTGLFRYIDEFEADVEQPYYESDAPETGGGPLRKVLVFRLRPKTIGPPQTQESRFAETVSDLGARQIPARTTLTEMVSIEERNTEKYFVDLNREPYEAERREAALVAAFKNFLIGRQHQVGRNKTIPQGEAKPIFTDIYDATANLLLEAKGVATREAVRMAVGQLIDYQRFLDQPATAILLPTPPRADLEALGHSIGIAFIWPEGDAYRASTERVEHLLPDARRRPHV